MAALLLGPAGAGAAQPAFIGDPGRTPRPGGLAVEGDGSFLMTYDATSSSRLARLSPAGQVVAEVGFGGRTVGRYGHLAVDRANGAIWHLSPQGIIDVFEPSTLQMTTLGDLKQTPISGTNDVYDVTIGARRDFSGGVTPGFASYGDIALRRDGGRLIVLVTGRATNGTPFVVRLRFDVTGGLAFQDARVIATSSVASQPAGNPRGIAVTPGGRVFTTLPAPDLSLSSYDRIFTFDDAYPEAGGAPIVGDRGRHLPTDGADAAADGSFYSTGQPTSVTCGAVSTGGATVLFPSGRIASCNAIGSFDAGTDVALGPDGRVFSLPPAGPILDWGRLAPGAEPASPPSGAVTPPAGPSVVKPVRRLAAPRISVPARVRIGTRSRAFSFTVRGPAGLRGTATLTRRLRARPRALQPTTVAYPAAASLARRSFRLGRKSGRARVTLKLSRTIALGLRRAPRAVTLTVQLRDSAGRTSRATRKLVLLAPRR